MGTKILLNEGTLIEVSQGQQEVFDRIRGELESENDTNYILLMKKEEKRFLYFFKSVHYYQIRLNLKRILFFYKSQNEK